LLRAADKLTEARFFLRRLAGTEGKLPRAAYYASATISALRSVTWVLQADLRSRHGERFDTWWDAQKLRLHDAGIGFALLRDARNESEKAGTPLVRREVRRTFSEGSIEAIEFLIDPGLETLGNFRIQFREPTVAPGSLGGPDPEKTLVDLMELKAKLDELRLQWVEGTADLDHVFGSSTRLPFKEAVGQLRDYTAVLSTVVAAAEREFAT